MPHKKTGFTLIELIIVIAFIAILAAAIFVAVDPAKRIGDTRDAIRASDALAYEKAIDQAIADDFSIFTTLDTMAEDTPYMIVTEGGDDSGTCNCDTLDQAIARTDITGQFKNYLGNDLPIDPNATGDDTGYYIQKQGNSFFVSNCYAYGDTYVAPVVCGDEVIEGAETCEFLNDFVKCPDLGDPPDTSGNCAAADVVCPGHESPASGRCLYCTWDATAFPACPS